MVATYQHFISNNKLLAFDFDPGGTSLTDIGWTDMLGFGGITVMFIRTIGTSATVMNIIANTVADGSGTDAVLKTHAVANEPNAVGDFIVLEVSAEELALHATAGLRGIGAQVSFATGTDEGVVVYILSEPTFAKQDLGEEVIA